MRPGTGLAAAWRTSAEPRVLGARRSWRWRRRSAWCWPGRRCTARVLLAVVMLSLAVMYACRGAVPGLRAGHRLHRRGADAVPVRAHDRRRQLGRLARGDDQRASGCGRRWPRSGCWCCCRLIIGHAAIGPARRAGAANFGTATSGPRHADLHHVRVPVRGDQRAADHRGARRDGAGAPGARLSPKPTQRELSVRRVASGRPAPLPGPGIYARHNAVDMPGAAARRHRRRHVGQPGDRRRPSWPGESAPRPGPRRRGGRPTGRGGHPADQRERGREQRGRGGKPGALRRAGGDPVRDRRAWACWSAGTRSSSSCASS